MTMSTEANKADTKKARESSAILRELDELMTYMDTDQSQESEELIDPAFFIGNMNENGPDVPTLTTIADEPAVKQPKEEEKQPGLFSARVERIKQKDSSQPSESIEPETSEVSQDELALMVDSLVAEQLPKLEAQLREKIMASLQTKKTS